MGSHFWSPMNDNSSSYQNKLSKCLVKKETDLFFETLRGVWTTERKKGKETK
jgi:hypothetical protein